MSVLKVILEIDAYMIVLIKKRISYSYVRTGIIQIYKNRREDGSLEIILYK